MNTSCDPPKGFEPPPLTEQKKRSFDTLFFSSITVAPPLALQPNTFVKDFNSLFLPDSELQTFKHETLDLEKTTETHYSHSSILNKSFTPATEEELLFLKISHAQRQFDHLAYVAYYTNSKVKALVGDQVDYTVQQSKVYLQNHPLHEPSCSNVNRNQFLFFDSILESLPK